MLVVLGIFANNKSKKAEPQEIACIFVQKHQIWLLLTFVTLVVYRAVRTQDQSFCLFKKSDNLRILGWGFWLG